MVPMRDGVRLRTDIIPPPDPGPFPVFSCRLDSGHIAPGPARAFAEPRSRSLRWLRSHSRTRGFLNRECVRAPGGPRLESDRDIKHRGGRQCS